MADIALLVDMASRLSSQIEIAELQRGGVSVINELKECLTDKKPSIVVVLEGFAGSETGISELILFKKLIGLEYVFISDNEMLLRQMARYARTFCCGTDRVGLSLVMAAVSEDAEALEPFLTPPKDKSLALCRMVLENPSVDPVMRDFALQLLNVSEDNKRLHISYGELKEEYDRVFGMNENKAAQLKAANDVLDQTLKQTVAVNDALAHYSFLCQKDVYRKVPLAEYRERPHIVYFKEYGDFLHLTTFIQTLAQTLKLQHDTPVKVLWILDKNNPLRQKYIPNYYTLFAEGVFSKATVAVSDYVATTSGYESIIQELCRNQSRVEYLLVVDSKLADDTVIATSEMLRYDLCRSIDKVRAYGLLDSRTIVNNEEGRELSWNHLWDYADLTPEDRYLYLSNRPVIRSVVKTAQRQFVISD